MRLITSLVTLLAAFAVAKGFEPEGGQEIDSAGRGGGGRATTGGSVDAALAHGNKQSQSAAAPTTCTRLPQKLSFSQDEALQSNNLLLRAATDLINQHLDGIVNVDLGLRGDTLQGHRVGAFDITARIRHLTASGAEATRCFVIPYEIRDVDECELPAGHPMRHVCHAAAVCVNTPGSYECSCADGGWGVGGSGSSVTPSKLAYVKRFAEAVPGTCGGERSTAACCGAKRAPCDESPAVCAANCKADFRCTRDPCNGVSCGAHARCEPGSGGGFGSYECLCDPGYHKSDGRCMPTPAKRKPDACAGHTCPANCRCEPAPSSSSSSSAASASGTAAAHNYACVAKRGFTAYTDPAAPPPPDAFPSGRRTDSVTACVSANAPTLALNGPNPLRLRQGDSYEELGCTVGDDNEEDDERTVTIRYSEPFGAYFARVGEYSVTYSVETPWLPVKSVKKVRRVLVSDVDECLYDGPLPAFRHRCIAMAACVNTVGGYDCRCPPGYAGDGLIGGSGCADVRKPTLECRGKGCEAARFRAVNSVGLAAVDGSKVFGRDGADDAFVEAFLRRLGPAVHCESGPARSTTVAAAAAAAAAAAEGSVVDGFGAGAAAAAAAMGSEGWGGSEGGGGDAGAGSGVCFVATDETFGGPVDLTASIVSGPLEAVPGKRGEWRFPYDVKDAAGNRAERLYYTIEVDVVAWDAAVGLAAHAPSCPTPPARSAATAPAAGLLGSVTAALNGSGSRVVSWFLTVAAAVLALWAAGRVLSALKTGFRALQYVLSPYSLVRSREDFDAAYGLVLRVQSLGTLSEKDRQRRTAAKWMELLDATAAATAEDENGGG